jgi:AraC-like DNA-binding protein
MVIVLSLGSITLYSAQNMAREHAVSGMLTGLEKTRDTVNARFVEINNMITQIIMFDKNVTYFANMNTSLKNADFCKMNELRGELNKYILSNSFIEEVYIYFERNEIMISPHFVYENVPRAYGTLFSYEDMDFYRWKEFALPNNSHNVIADSKTFYHNSKGSRVVPIISSLSVRSHGNRGAITVLIPEEKLEEHLNYMKSIDSSADSIGFFIMDAQGNVLVSDGAHELPTSVDMSEQNEPAGHFALSFNKTDYTMAYVTCPDTGWTYAAAIPPEYFNSAVQYISNTYLVVTLGAFVLGLIIAILMAFQTSKPLRSTLEILRTEAGIYRGERNNNDYITGTLQNIIAQNTDISKRLDDQKPFLREAIMKKLLLGGFSGSDEVSIALSYIDIKMQDGGFVVGLMQIGGYGGNVSDTLYDEVNMSKLVAEDLISRNREQPCHFCNIDDDKMAVIFQTGNPDDAKRLELKGRLENIVTELASLGINATFSLGDFCVDTMDISRSYQQAEQVAAFSITGDSVRVRSFDTIEITHSGYYYPMDVELQLMNLTKMGEKEKAQALITHIYNENFSAGGLPQEDVYQLLYELRGTLVKLWSEVVKDREEAQTTHSFQNTIGALDMHAPLEDLYSGITSVFISFCDVINEKKRSHNLDLKNRILEYINLNYYNPSLCLYDVASQFGLSDKYLSDFFKEQTGENFSTYVESLRMDRILGMLKEDNLSISSIASQSGYYSANTLYKVFKRKFGISPGTYRQHYALNKGQ